jgi:hypothetical protein
VVGLKLNAPAAPEGWGIDPEIGKLLIVAGTEHPSAEANSKFFNKPSKLEKFQAVLSGNVTLSRFVTIFVW